MDRSLPWLRFVDADDLGDSQVDFDGMRVESPTGEHLGDVDGFIVDSESGRPYYVVVDAGGWFKSKHFLLPIGHAEFDTGNEALRADLTRDRVERFPGFERDVFDSLTPDDMKRLNADTLRACIPTGGVYAYSAVEPYSADWNRPDFRYPEWWRSGADGPRQARAATISSDSVGSTSRPIARPAVPSTAREAVVAHADPSPHYDGRAQPGDIIGVETEGEQTHLGDTGDDENERREDAEKKAGKRRP
jgi:PRC-barrel domain protein